MRQPLTRHPIPWYRWPPVAASIPAIIFVVAWRAGGRNLPRAAKIINFYFSLKMRLLQDKIDEVEAKVAELNALTERLRGHCVALAEKRDELLLEQSLLLIEDHRS